jgi:hypothetical protein
MIKIIIWIWLSLGLISNGIGILTDIIFYNGRAKDYTLPKQIFGICGGLISLMFALKALFYGILYSFHKWIRK